MLYFLKKFSFGRLEWHECVLSSIRGSVEQTRAVLSRIWEARCGLHNLYCSKNVAQQSKLCYSRSHCTFLLPKCGMRKPF